MKIDKEKALKLYNEGKNDSQIASELGATHTGIRHWRIKNNLPPNTSSKPKADYKKMMDLYSTGLSDRDIANLMGINSMTVYQWRKSNKLKPNVKSGWPARDAFAKILDGFEPSPTDKPWKDPESLFCDTKFLESIFKKSIKKCECGSNA